MSSISSKPNDENRKPDSPWENLGNHSKEVDKGKILVIATALLFIALFLGLFLGARAQTASFINVRIPQPIWDGKTATVGTIAQLTTDQYTRIMGRLDYIQKLINDVQDTCAAR